jgi:AcrR family transcriptional regulator
MDPAPSHPHRRTQAQRSSSTRARLLEATVECLNELGFAGTTTTAIADRAGVSRGAQLHHYPTKRDLVAAAIEHVLDRRIQEFREGFAARATTSSIKERAQAAVEQMWALTSGSTFYAWLELLVAARTDPELRTAMTGIAKRFEEGMLKAFHELFPEQADNPAVDLAPWFTMATLQGFALARVVEPDDVRLPVGLSVLSAMGARALRREEDSK